MASAFLEIIFNSVEFPQMGVHGRDEVADPIEEALSNEGVGEVVGGGAGSGVVMIEVEIEDEENLEKGVEVIRKVLRGMGCPRSTFIRKPKPSERTYRIYD